MKTPHLRPAALAALTLLAATTQAQSGGSGTINVITKVADSSGDIGHARATTATAVVTGPRRLLRHVHHNPGQGAAARPPVRNPGRAAAKTQGETPS